MIQTKHVSQTEVAPLPILVEDTAVRDVVLRCAIGKACIKFGNLNAGLSLIELSSRFIPTDVTWKGANKIEEAIEEVIAVLAGANEKANDLVLKLNAISPLTRYSVRGIRSYIEGLLKQMQIQEACELIRNTNELTWSGLKTHEINSFAKHIWDSLTFSDVRAFIHTLTPDKNSLHFALVRSIDVALIKLEDWLEILEFVNFADLQQHEEIDEIWKRLFSRAKVAQIAWMMKGIIEVTHNEELKEQFLYEYCLTMIDSDFLDEAKAISKRLSADRGIHARKKLVEYMIHNKAYDQLTEFISTLSLTEDKFAYELSIGYIVETLLLLGKTETLREILTAHFRFRLTRLGLIELLARHDCIDDALNLLEQSPLSSLTQQARIAIILALSASQRIYETPKHIRVSN
ncbi:hypothetical protein HC928_21255 [bacterium]|nr:hypothetical protein [bacterium]